MYIKDRFTRGMLAGIVAGILTKTYDLLAYYLNFSTLRWFEVSGVFIFGKRPVSLGEAIFATLSTWFFHAMLGMIFVFLIERLISSDNLILKGWSYGVFWWFIIYAAIIMVKMPEFKFIPLKTSLSNLIGASIWGIVMAMSINWLNNKSKIR